MTPAKIYADINKIFEEKFSKSPHIYFSPGRINIIGEHVDYNDGYVMPGAINKGIYYAVNLNDTGTINFYSIVFDESISIAIDDVHKMDGWKNYVLGVIHEFLVAGKKLRGFDCVFGGDIPNGAGMSSSAAVEGGLAFALNELLQIGFTRKELALLCQRAEHHYPGVMCGIMDQYANMNGKQNNVMLLDCKSVTHQYLPFEIDGYSLVLINSKVHHSLAASAYNKRRRECEKGLQILSDIFGINSFREVNIEQVKEAKNEMPRDIYNRCLYVSGEISRTLRAAKFLKENNIISLGRLMYETHEGLSKLYEVSCAELDFLVDFAKRNKVTGARLMGGGFGGCTINIIRDEIKELFLGNILTVYKNAFAIDAEVYEVKIVDGTHRVQK